ncbi:RbsD/FucU domain-containing protein [Serratia ficaria]|uniref:RbsD/FucU domain-containing protein n=1 Tax=Serratia ficaria TaxID=61651 RepID=UPI0036F34051
MLSTLIKLWCIINEGCRGRWQPRPQGEARYREAFSGKALCPEITCIDRFAFYEHVQKTFVIVITGEYSKYGIIL